MTKSVTKKIKHILEDIEEEKGVRIIFAVEGGSRVWGFESKDSDYDVRFVYKRPLRKYIKARPSKTNHMEKVVDDVDMVGFDILKFTGLNNFSIR
jgi:predicted nucleotidyltransferase